MTKFTKDIFLKKYKEMYGEKYDYSEMNYKNSTTKIKIICNEHGEFYQLPHNHLRGHGCPICAHNDLMEKNKRSFFIKARETHCDKYDYTKAEYIDSKTKVRIICPKHGEFWQTPKSHIEGMGCPKCSIKVYDNESFIEEAIKKHGNKYTYSKVEYKNRDLPIIITCPIHGDFKQVAKDHINGHGCPLCSNNKRLTNEEFITISKEVHGDKYDYSKVNYINNHTNVCIICPKHGEFWQAPVNHIKGKGCKKCADNQKLTKDEFIKRAVQVHGKKYDYSKVEYKNNRKKVCIICPEHGEFWQTSGQHLQGNGCPKCSLKKNMCETKLYEFVNSNLCERVERIRRFKWLGLKSIDIFIPKYNIGIEYQGEQHFRPVEYFGGVDKFNKTVRRDKEKYDLCKLNGIKLFYFSKEKNLPDEYFDKIYTDEDELLTEIKRLIEENSKNKQANVI